MNQEKLPSELKNQEKESTQKSAILNESQVSSTKSVTEVKVDNKFDEWDDWHPDTSH